MKYAIKGQETSIYMCKSGCFCGVQVIRPITSRWRPSLELQAEDLLLDCRSIGVPPPECPQYDSADGHQSKQDERQIRSAVV